MKTERLELRLTPDDCEWLREQAGALGMPVVGVVRTLIRQARGADTAPFRTNAVSDTARFRTDAVPDNATGAPEPDIEALMEAAPSLLEQEPEAAPEIVTHFAAPRYRFQRAPQPQPQTLPRPQTLRPQPQGYIPPGAFAPRRGLCCNCTSPE